jgi:DNA-directed RNA polymerase subunit N (RpoN/RPB10)
MDIKVDVPLRCVKCGGAKYVDEPYLLFDTWFVDIVCLTCGHTKDIPVEEFKVFAEKLNRAVKKSNVK